MTPTDPAPPRTYRGGFLLFATATAVLLAVLIGNGVRDEFARSAAYTQVQDLLRMQEAAWNKGDLDGFMAGYRMSDEITFYSEGKVEREGKTASGLFTVLLRKFPEGWWVVHDHTSAAPG